MEVVQLISLRTNWACVLCEWTYLVSQGQHFPTKKPQIIIHETGGCGEPHRFLKYGCSAWGLWFMSAYQPELTSSMRINKRHKSLTRLWEQTALPILKYLHCQEGLKYFLRVYIFFFLSPLKRNQHTHTHKHTTLWILNALPGAVWLGMCCPLVAGNT